MMVDYESPVGKSLGKKTLVGQHVGLELEYEKCKPLEKAMSPNWWTDVDHSLRAGGLEFISTPLKRTEVHKAIGDMLSTAISVGATVTPRCGLHVHVNVTDSTWRELYKFVTYYTLLEPRLFEEFAPGREMSHFCVPTWTNTALAEYMYLDGQRLRRGIRIPGGTGQNWRNAASYLGTSSMGGGRSRLQMLNTPKYAALNIASLKKFGTLEFRQAPSSLSPSFIEKWTMLLLEIQKVSQTYNDATDIIKDYDTRGILTLCEKVGFFPRGGIDELDQEDAVDTATILAGHVPVNWQELLWEIK